VVSSPSFGCKNVTMPRDLETAVVRLVAKITGARLGQTPHWLHRPGATECRDLWSLVCSIYSDLTGMELPEVMPSREWRQVDTVLEIAGSPHRICEFDETQHFNSFRALTLQHYASKVPLAFDAELWIARSEAKTRLEGGGFGKSRNRRCSQVDGAPSSKGVSRCAVRHPPAATRLRPLSSDSGFRSEGLDLAGMC
jgi:hypothetical protein